MSKSILYDTYLHIPAVKDVAIKDARK